MASLAFLGIVRDELSARFTLRGAQGVIEPAYDAFKTRAERDDGRLRLLSR
jgi:hypothetical protein